MPYAGIYLMAREVAALSKMVQASNGTMPFKNRKVELLATGIGESQLCVGAWHDNLAAGDIGARVHTAMGTNPELMEGKTASEAKLMLVELFNPVKEQVASRDCGVMQINIPARLLGTEAELALRTESHDRDEATRVALQNLHAAAELFITPWVAGRKRQWQPWVAWTSGWAPYPEAWCWSRVTPDTWVATGRFLHKAIRGVANEHWKAGDLSLTGALHEAERLASFYKITKGILWIDPKNQSQGVQWRYPPKPTAPGSAADYPKPNAGLSIIHP